MVEIAFLMSIEKLGAPLLMNDGLGDPAMEDIRERSAKQEDTFKLDGPTLVKLTPVLAGIFMVNLNVALTAPFFPLYAQKHYGATQIVIGAIFCTYPFTIFLASPVMGIMCNKFGRMPVLNGGLLLASMGSFLFGSAKIIQLYFVARFIQGVGAAAVIVACTALNTANFPQSLGTVMGMQEAAVGLGFMLGPVVGGALVGFGFEVPTRCCCLFLFVCQFVLFVCLCFWLNLLCLNVKIVAGAVLHHGLSGDRHSFRNNSASWVQPR